MISAHIVYGQKGNGTAVTVDVRLENEAELLPRQLVLLGYLATAISEIVPQFVMAEHEDEPDG